MIHILIIHGCPLFRVGLRSVLARQDDCCIIGEATHLEEVLALARTAQIDVVLLDAGLATADPCEVMEYLRVLSRAAILVFASQNADEEELFCFLKHGAMAYMSCSISSEELLAKLHGMVHGEYFVAGDVLLAESARHARLEYLRQVAMLAEKSKNAPHVVPETASPLTDVERTMLTLFAAGTHTAAQIAAALGIGVGTVKHRAKRLYSKLEVRGRTQAVVVAMQRRWINVEPQNADLVVQRAAS